MKIAKDVSIILSLVFIISVCFPCLVASAETVPVITKNPTSESLAIGGKTWFIAHADNANSMSWELIDPNGLIHTLEETMQMNPGLSLQALEGDTIAVSNVPLSLNGWGVQATFYCDTGSVSTTPAYIFVGDFLNTYNKIIEKYKIAKQNNIRGAGDAYEYNVSEWITYYDHVGYALKDIDKNGIPELLISGIEAPYDYGPILFEIYTLVNNTPTQILISWARNRYYLMTDNKIYNEGSGGAADSIFEFYNLVGDHLEFVEGLRTTNDYDSSGMTVYHSSAWNGETGAFTVHGDYNHPDYSFSRDEQPNLFDAFQSQCWMPQLTIIA